MADDQDDWRRGLAFSDRLAKTTAISNAYSTAYPDNSISDARTDAKAREAAARVQAKSLQEYHELCAQVVAGILASADAITQPDLHASEHVFPNLPEHGASIGKYTNAQHYRDGLFSEVFVARHPEQASQLVALKITTPGMMTPPHDSKREARILHAIKDCPQIVDLIETFSDSHSRFVLVFPFMPFELSTLLAQHALPQHSQKTIARDVLSALGYLHARNIIHRDIKPSNILLATPSGPAYLADFGIAWSATDPASEPQDEKILDVGTTSYRPPELLFGNQRYTSAIDMWATGCVIAQVACLGRETLFDSGELGSELALIKSIFETFGTPDLDTWPEAASMPDWGKMNFVKYPARSWEQILSQCEPTARQLVSSLVTFQSTDRLTAQQALQHTYFQES